MRTCRDLDRGGTFSSGEQISFKPRLQKANRSWELVQSLLWTLAITDVRCSSRGHGRYADNERHYPRNGLPLVILRNLLSDAQVCSPEKCQLRCRPEPGLVPIAWSVAPLTGQTRKSAASSLGRLRGDSFEHSTHLVLDRSHSLTRPHLTRAVTRLSSTSR